jgi:hypothetical protein
MPMDSVTSENVASILKEKEDTEKSLAELMAMTLEEMWLTELQKLEREYAIYKTKREQLQCDQLSKDGSKIKKVKKLVVKGK